MMIKDPNLYLASKNVVGCCQINSNIITNVLKSSYINSSNWIRGAMVDSRRVQSPNFQHFFLFLLMLQEMLFCKFFQCFRKCILFLKNIKRVRMKSNLNIAFILTAQNYLDYQMNVKLIVLNPNQKYSLLNQYSHSLSYGMELNCKTQVLCSTVLVSV